MLENSYSKRIIYFPHSSPTIEMKFVKKSFLLFFALRSCSFPRAKSVLLYLVCFSSGRGRTLPSPSAVGVIAIKLRIIIVVGGRGARVN